MEFKLTISLYILFLIYNYRLKNKWKTKKMCNQLLRKNKSQKAPKSMFKKKVTFKKPKIRIMKITNNNPMIKIKKKLQLKTRASRIKTLNLLMEEWILLRSKMPCLNS